MDKWIKENKIASGVIIAFVLILIGFYFISQQWLKNGMSSAELYKINSDCAKEAQTWAKDNSGDFIGAWHWTVEHSAYNNNISSCVAEFSSYDSVVGQTTNVIRNLTHSEELASMADITLYEIKQDGLKKDDFFSNQHDIQRTSYYKIYNKNFGYTDFTKQFGE